VKKILWILIVISFLGSVSVPIQILADGGMPPSCPNQKSCKPLEVGSLRG